MGSSSIIVTMHSTVSPSNQLHISDDFRPRWRHRWTHCASSHNQKLDNNKFKNNKQPELPENQTVWESDNQGVKKETLTQTSRRGGDGQLGGEDSRQSGGLQTGWSHIHVQINWEEQLGSETNPQPRFPAQGNKASNL